MADIQYLTIGGASDSAYLGGPTSVAWTYDVGFSELTAGFSYPIGICGIAVSGQTVTPTLDATREGLVSIGKGGSGAEVTIISIPFNVRMDTAVGYWFGQTIWLPEPVYVSENTRISIRWTSSYASGTNTAVKFEVFYKEYSSPKAEMYSLIQSINRAANF